MIIHYRSCVSYCCGVSYAEIHSFQCFSFLIFSFLLLSFLCVVMTIIYFCCQRGQKHSALVIIYFAYFILPIMSSGISSILWSFHRRLTKGIRKWLCVIRPFALLPIWYAGLHLMAGCDTCFYLWFHMEELLKSRFKSFQETILLNPPSGHMRHVATLFFRNPDRNRDKDGRTCDLHKMNINETRGCMKKIQKNG